MPSLTKQKGLKVSYDKGSVTLEFKLDKRNVRIDKTLSGSEARALEKFISTRREEKGNANEL